STDILLDACLYLILTRIWILPNNSSPAHHHAWYTKTALDSSRLGEGMDEGLLLKFCKPFYCKDFLILKLRKLLGTRKLLAISYKDSTSPTSSLGTTVLYRRDM